MSEALVQYQAQPQAMSLTDTMQLGKAMAESGFFSDSKQAAQAVVKILAGRELGFGPVASMTGINVIKGKITLSANLIAASVKRSGRYNYRVTKLDDTGCSIDFYENGQPVGSSTFTADDAKAAGLAGDNWRKFPRNMFFARAMSNGAKWYCPDLSGGPLYTPDELGATVDGESGEVVEIPAEVSPPVGRPKNGNGKNTTPETVTLYGSPSKMLARCNELIGGESYYTHTEHLKNANGGWPDWTNLEAVKAYGAKAVNHGKQRRAEKVAEEPTAEPVADVLDEIPW